MSRFQGFIGPTYTTQSVNVECQRTVNLFPQINELHTGAEGEIGALVATPGTKLLATIGTGPVRGLYATSTGRLVAVSGNQVFRINADWTTALVGTINTSTGPVGMADNTTQVIIVDGPNGYIISLNDGTLKQIVSEGFPGATNVVFQDGYFICNNPGTGQFFLSSLYDGFTWDALDFATAEGSPDQVVTLLSDRRQIWLFGSKTVEVWYNSGDANFPLSRFDGAFIEYGCAAAWTAKQFANTVIWLGAGSNADGIVWMAQGYQPQRISNHAVEVAIQALGDISEATAYVYQKNGHMFYVLNLPGAATSWVYDISTSQWHERAYLNAGAFERHRGDCYAWCYDTDVVGDYVTGNVYALDDATRTDNGAPLKWVRRAPHLSDGMKRMVHNRFQVDAQMGTGLDGTALGTDPVIVMRYSDDYGNTWSTERTKALGKIGQYRTRAYWDRLGASRTRVYELSGTDPVAITLLGAELQITGAAS